MRKTSDSVLIRRFQPDDALALYNVFYSAIHLIASSDYSAQQINAWAPANLDQVQWARRMNGIKPLVADLNGEVVGYADIQANGYVDHFYVSGHYPRQGIGTRLMEALESEAKRQRMSELTSHVSNTAKRFFERFGFQTVMHQISTVRGVDIPNVLMRKHIECAHSMCATC